MTIRRTLFAAATAKLLNISAAISAPAVPPQNLLTGRFVWELTASGYGYPGLTSSPADGLSVWDWDSTANRYEMTNFATTSGWANSYGTRGTGKICYANATTVIVIGNGTVENATDTKVGRSVTTIGAAPSASVTFTTPAAYSYDDPGVNVTQRSAAYPYAGSMVYGVPIDAAAGVWGTANGWLAKVSTSAAVRNATALRTGLPADSTQGSPALSIAALGGATPNGYFVANVDDKISNANCRYQLVNCTGTPVAVGSQLSYSGNSFNQAAKVMQLGASSVVAFDFGSTAAGRAALLVTNSATAPTALTKGAEVAFPAPIDFPVGDLINAQQAVVHTSWIAEGKSMCWAYWVTFAGSFLRPMIISSSGPANISLSLPAVDMNGRASPLRTFVADAGYIVAAPGGKAVLFVPAAAGQYDQFVYQL